MRRRLGLSLDAMAQALGIDRMTWWRWERPRSNPQYREPPPYLWRALRDLEERG